MPDDHSELVRRAMDAAARRDAAAFIAVVDPDFQLYPDESRATEASRR